jgi:hypothetical protein
MKVKFVQSGGFAGIVKGCELNTRALAPQAAGELEHLTRGSGLSASGTFLSKTGRDLQQYEIIIEDDNRKAEVVLDDATIPQSAKPLLGFWKKHARPKPLD